MDILQFCDTMFPQPADRANYSYPEDGLLLQAYGVVQDAEIRNPQHLDIHNERCLLVVKNRRTTGTTAGRVNGLESFVRHYDDNIQHASTSIAVYHYGKDHGTFSEAGDSGAIVLARDGLLAGGAGSSARTDISYTTPYWWLEARIKARFPGCFLYDVVE